MRNFVWVVFILLMFIVSREVHAFTGSGDSATGGLETVKPTLTGITVPTSSSVQAAFSEPMRAAGLTTPGNYVVSGPGAGTLGANPASASGSGPVTLTWSTGEGQSGAMLGLTVTGVQDALGNPINTAANTASGTGAGVAPVFSGLTVTPSSASAGETVRLEFSSSEALDGDPEVFVNGNLATRTAKAAFTYEYTVLSTDPLGPVDVDITGFDLAGNLGALNAPDALEIVATAANVPLRAWPAALALLAVGALVLTCRRKTTALLMLALLVAPAALAASPAVTNVSFVQQPTVTGTEVVITYDLVSPNGPSNITVKLSKNGGVDGFAFPVISVLGDLSGVTTGTGYNITWDIAADYPDEDIPNARLRVTADDGITQYTLTYTAGAGGTISGTTPQTVNAGEDGTAVTAVPDAGFVFVNWSDGGLTATRTDTNVLANLSVAANFIALPEMISVAAGTFDMGRTSSGDDATFGGGDELPVHTVTLSAYQIGKYEVTNQQYCDLLNYAIDASRNYLRTSANAVWAGTDDIYAGGNLQKILGFTDTNCNLQFSAGSFSPKTRVGLPGSTNYATGTHPVQNVTWFGAASFANWLSEIEGRTPVYDAGTAGWPANPANNGYHLPTEAQWERAAAWDGTHRIYGFTADTLTGKNRANHYDATPTYVNPMGLTTTPYTSPAGWFNGVNLNPNGSISTTNSVSPVGCYDMSGNVWEWCHDWYLSTYYTTSPGTDPPGAASGSGRAIRGGSWDDDLSDCRSARRFDSAPGSPSSSVGFRLARTIAYSLRYAAGTGGSLTGNTTQTVLPGGDGTAVTAVPDAGFAFVNWSDGVTDNPRTDTNVGSGVTVTANFASLPVEMISVAGGSFDMGRTAAGDDATYGAADELPVHTVTLSAYKIGKYEVTNQQYCDVLNYAIAPARNYLRTSANAVWSGTGDIYAGGNLQKILGFSSGSCNIQFSAGSFSPKTRAGLPGGTNYSTRSHPVQFVTWYGAASFANWLSEMEGLTPVYDASTAGWPANLANNGYHLPTEAQWERAAAWDGTKHWIYGLTSDTLSGSARANEYAVSAYVNPLGLTAQPFTSPAGWFDGVHVSPKGTVSTTNSASPAGCYDMSGNILEWCHDWYLNTYYSTSPGTDPPGDTPGAMRVLRGGSWDDYSYNCRSAKRYKDTPDFTNFAFGFRLAR